MTNRIIILAGSRQQFETYLDENGLTDSEAVYGFEPRVIQGIRASKVVKTGTWYERKDANELLELAESRVF